MYSQEQGTFVYPSPMCELPMNSTGGGYFAPNAYVPESTCNNFEYVYPPTPTTPVLTSSYSDQYMLANQSYVQAQTISQPLESETKIEYDSNSSDIVESPSTDTLSSPSDEGEEEEEAAEEQECECEYAHDGTLILLDWDDTLFPTTFINEILNSRDKNDLCLVRDDQIEALANLGNATLSLLTALVTKYGQNNVHIVTNSLNGWIAESLCYAACITKIYKQIQTFLEEHDITMISAQSKYAKKHIKSTPLQWKQLTFDDILKSDKTKSSYSHIISIGDQITDHYSVKKCIESLTAYSPIHHMIKLKMSPTVNDMINEIRYIDTCFFQIFDVISSTKSAYFANPTAVKPVIIDYETEEMKLYYKNITHLNVNFNLNLNVNINK